MSTDVSNEQIISRGKEFFTSISGEAPSIFNKGWWTGKVMDWSMRNEDFKVKLFRFVDVMPYLQTSDSLTRHIEEYFASDDGELPSVMKFGLKGAGMMGKIGGKLMAKSIRGNIEKMGRQFIVGQTAPEAIKNLEKIRKDGFAFVLDVLGEATVSEEEADERLQEHLDLLDAVGKNQKKWKALGGGKGDKDWGYEPILNLSVKPTAFYSQTKPVDFEGSVQGIFKRLLPVCQKAKELGGFVCIDMESLDIKDITIEVYKRLLTHPDLKDYPHIGIVLQSYLRCTDQDLDELLGWAREQNRPISIRLVKGAYWDYETVKAKQYGWEVPVYTVKADSDAAFERHAAMILKNHDICHLACGSHNVRSIAAIMETAIALNVPEERYEFQALYGMAEPVRKGLLGVAKRVRLYCPYGDLIPGMAYLVRRLLENTANESFLRQSFAEEGDMERLLEDPVSTAERERAEKKKAVEETPGLAPFINEPLADFTIKELREEFTGAIASVRSQAGKTYPLYINGQDVSTSDVMDSYNPAKTTEILGKINQAGVAEVDSAMEAAKAALPAWRDTPPEERAQYLFKAADIARKRIVELSAWQVLEVGKQWDQAYADVCEAIDFLEYYGREMIRLGAPRRMGNAPGELNHYLYRPKGVAAVIAPWNFPLAISLGMVSAAVVTGNCVLYKPSSIASIIGYNIVDLFKEAGLPAGVFNYVPGRSSVMGDHLVKHPDVGMIAFTGSMEVGLHIMHQATDPATIKTHCKKVIAEMGGKNAIIVDDDAELDEAVHHVLYSAFGFQGQKCSACSRVIVLKDVYDRFIPRLVEAARSIKIGPSEDPSNVMGPVVDRSAQKNVLKYVELAKQEGNLLLEHTPHTPSDDACYAPLTIVDGITPEHRIAQEEVFGPVLAVMKAEDYTQALEWANATKFALTGAVLSRSPQNLERARKEFAVGNLYLNRNNTGALVERQPFGGFNLSGIGSKAGGPDYLLQFMDPVTITENTMRRGFAPIEKDDDWV